MNTQICANITGDVCNNGQAAFYYSQVRSPSARSLPVLPSELLQPPNPVRRHLLCSQPRYSKRVRLGHLLF